jgi:hypothetical protein
MRRQTAIKKIGIVLNLWYTALRQLVLDIFTPIPISIRAFRTSKTSWLSHRSAAKLLWD